MMGLQLCLCGCLLATAAPQDRQVRARLRGALTFAAGFDGGGDATIGKGDRRLYVLGAETDQKPRAGLEHAKHVVLAKGEGRYGDGLRFTQKTPALVFFEAKDNLEYQDQNWEGTVSLWLKLDPDKELKPGYCDPLQITDKSALDDSLFIEFTKDHTPRRFRLAVCPGVKKWNPSNREWETIPIPERPVVEVEKPPFRATDWTHVAFTWQRFNSGSADGTATLYLNGVAAGHIENRKQDYAWQPGKVRIMLGLSYLGLFDELAIFNRALNADEIRALRDLRSSITEAGRRARRGKREDP